MAAYDPLSYHSFKTAIIYKKCFLITNMGCYPKVELVEIFKIYSERADAHVIIFQALQNNVVQQVQIPRLTSLTATAAQQISGNNSESK